MHWHCSVRDNGPSGGEMEFIREDSMLNNFHRIIIFITVVHGSCSNRTDPHCVRDLTNRVQKDTVSPGEFKTN